MYFVDPLMVDRLSSMYVDSAQEQAQLCRLRRQAEKRPHSAGQWLLHHLGRQLVEMGRLLEQLGSPQLSH